MTIDTTKITPEKLAEMNDSLIVDNNHLRQQLAECKRDAARYRWIRKCMPFSTYENLTLKRDAKSYNIDTKLDEAIDAALSEPKGD